MNGTATALLVAAALFAVVDWIAVAPPLSATTVEYVAKPLTTGLLIGVALTLDPVDSAQRAVFVAALLFLLAGDVFLMLPSDAFTAGLGSFLLAHIAYAVGFAREVESGTAFAVGAAIVLASFGPIARRIVAGARNADRRLAVPVAVYVAAIGTMGTLALATYDVRAAAGAVLFMSSDTLVGLDRFVAPIPWVRPVIMATYHVGQALLVLSLVR
jgi:uncharacterized membrane protein YhhN